MGYTQHGVLNFFVVYYTKEHKNNNFKSIFDYDFEIVIM
jgi:hypothetical protein